MQLSHHIINIMDNILHSLQRWVDDGWMDRQAYKQADRVKPLTIIYFGSCIVIKM